METITPNVNMKHITLHVLSITLGSLNAGYQAGVMNSMAQTCQYLYKWSDGQRDTNMNIASSILTIIATISSLWGSFIVKRLGRRGMLMLANILAIIACVTISFQTFICLIIGRILFGVMMGFFFYLCPLFTRESVPPYCGGFYGSFHQLMIVTGIGIAYALSLFLPNEEELHAGVQACWRQIFWVPAIVSLLQIFLFLVFFKNDTPKSLFLKGNTEQCANTLKDVYKNNKDVLAAIEGFKEEKDMNDNITFSTLFSKTKNIIGICLFLAIFQQLSGINSITYFSTNIFNTVLKNDRQAIIATALLGAVQIMFTFISLFIVDRLGRKKLFIIGSVLCGLAMGMFGYYYKPNSENVPIWKEYCCIGAMGFFFISFALTHGPLCWIYLGEVMHQKTLPIAVAGNLLFNVITVMWTLPLVGRMKEWFFYMYGMCMAICLVMCIIFVKETKGLTDKEIQQIYSNSNDNALAEKSSLLNKAMNK